MQDEIQKVIRRMDASLMFYLSQSSGNHEQMTKCEVFALTKYEESLSQIFFPSYCTLFLHKLSYTPYVGSICYNR